jgi:RNA polymerase sigma-70 factor, ECF subfamily
VLGSRRGELSAALDRAGREWSSLATTDIERARRGDRAARARLVEVYQDRIYAVCRALAGVDAYDCAHDSLIKILTGLDGFDATKPTPFGAFVIRVARNTCIDRARSAHVRKRGDVVIEDLASPAAVGPDERVRAAVLALPTEQRTAIVLRMWGELDYEQIAELEQVPIGTVRSRLARARDALRQALSDEEVADAS